jgi:glycosyltransferase involved in cell wall biosynthesis
MRAAIYNPYMDTLGGGERYTMAFAMVLSQKTYNVDVQWKSKSIKKKLEDRFGLKLKNINIVKDIKRGDGYDVCFWVSDGSIPLLRARYNFIHFQFPFKNVNGETLINKMKLYRVNKIICNSYFTKKNIDREYGVDSIVIYPPVDIDKIKPKRKENIILSVGRFSQLTQAKRQDVLIAAFKKLCDLGYDDWRLILAGGVEVGVDSLSELKEEARGYPIDIIESPDFKEIVKLYGKSKIFWSASGYGRDEKKEPKKVEHFGITVVEAMAAKVAPLIYSAGGHKEIVKNGFNGYLWKKRKELVRKTRVLIEDSKLLRKLSKNAKESSKVYEYARFETQVCNLIR